MMKPAFLVNTYGYGRDALDALQKDLCDRYKDYRIVTIEPQETFVIVIWEIRGEHGEEDLL